MVRQVGRLLLLLLILTPMFSLNITDTVFNRLQHWSKNLKALYDHPWRILAKQTTRSGTLIVDTCLILFSFQCRRGWMRLLFSNTIKFGALHCMTWKIKKKQVYLQLPQHVWSFSWDNFVHFMSRKHTWYTIISKIWRNFIVNFNAWKLKMLHKFWSTETYFEWSLQSVCFNMNIIDMTQSLPSRYNEQPGNLSQHRDKSSLQ